MSDMQRRWSWWWWALRLVAAAAACLLALLASAAPAAAHASLVSTDPVDGTLLAKSPGQATLTFDEPVSLPREGVKVFDADGEPITASASTTDALVTVDLPDRMADGTYVVVWRIISADGHPLAGSLTFSVGQPSLHVVPPKLPDTAGAAVTIAVSTVQAATDIGLLLAVGLGIFAVLLVPPHIRADRPRRRMRTVTTWSAVVSVVAATATLPLTVIYQHGGSLTDLTALETWTSTSLTTLIALTFIAVGLLLVRVAVEYGLPVVRQRAALGVGSCLAVVSPALTGHSRAFEPQAPVIAVDVLHVLAGSIWLGGLVGLAITLPAIAGRGTHAAEVLGRFSNLAASVLAALVAAGGMLAWRIVASWENLFGTRYGWLLLSKIVLVALAAAIAAWNRYVLVPRARTDGGHQERLSTTARLRRVVTVEAAVIVVVLALTGFLVNQSPRPEVVLIPDGRTGGQITQLGTDVNVLATMTPARVGQNTVLVQFQDLSGEPLEPTRLPEISLRCDELDLGRVKIRSVTAGTFRADVVLPRPGVWRVQISLRLDKFDNPVAVVTFNVTD
jgi:copper transport protein